MKADIHPQQPAIEQVERNAIMPRRPACIWLAGLSGSVKSIFANAVEARLSRRFRAHA